MNEIRDSNAFKQLFEDNDKKRVVDESTLRTKNNICKKFLHSRCDDSHCIYLHDLSKAVPCRNFQQSGYCSKGNTCDYLHGNNNNQKRKEAVLVCKKFREQGYCPEGNNCPYKHSKILCKDFEKGFCMNGKECKELHRETLPCRDYLLGFCPKGPNCHFTHNKVFYDFDYGFLKEWDRDVNISKCTKCEQYGHKDANCKREVIFTNVPQYPPME